MDDRRAIIYSVANAGVGKCHMWSTVDQYLKIAQNFDEYRPHHF